MPKDDKAPPRKTVWVKGPRFARGQALQIDEEFWPEHEAVGYKQVPKPKETR